MEYIHEEIDQVIYGRGLESFEEYAAAERDGRREGLRGKLEVSVGTSGR